MSRKVSGLTVIECKYCYNKWNADVKDGRTVFWSEIKELEHREVDTYHESGVYNTRGVPVTVHDLDYENYKQYEPWEGVTREISDTVCEAVKRGDVVMMPGGYCNYATPVAGGLQRALGKDKTIGVVYMDAHTDCRVPGRSSNVPVRFVSFPVSTLTGVADYSLKEYRQKVCGLEDAILGENFIASDIRIMDEESANNFVAANIRWLDGSVFADGAAWKREIDALAQRVDAIFLSLDVDILKAEYIPSYFKAVPYGHDIDTVIRNVKTVMDTGKVAAYGLWCINFDLIDQHPEVTYDTVIRLMRAGLENWQDTTI